MNSHMTHTLTRSTRRPLTDGYDGDGAPEIEIEVTPEMIAAGAAVLCRFETFTASEAYWAEEVYRAMRAAT
jgi:hypothetical protein